MIFGKSYFNTLGQMVQLLGRVVIPSDISIPSPAVSTNFKECVSTDHIRLFWCLPNLFLLPLGLPTFAGMPDKGCKLVAPNEGLEYGYINAASMPTSSEQWGVSTTAVAAVHSGLLELLKLCFLYRMIWLIWQFMLMDVNIKQQVK